jgi:pilus assembly protein CpaE
VKDYSLHIPEEKMRRPAPTLILIVDNDSKVRNALSDMLTQQGYMALQSESAEAAYALIMRQLPDLLVMNVALPGMDGYTFCRQLSQNQATRLLPIILQASQGDLADKIAGFKAGANDYVTIPYAPEELLYRIKNLISLIQKPAPAPAQPSALGRITAVFAAKGGVGKTVISSNLAVALRQVSGKKVALMDADFSFGLVGVNLNMSTTHNIMELIQRIDDLDPELFQSVMVHHISGIHVLLCPFHPEEAELISADHIHKILNLLAEQYDEVVVDCHGSYRTLQVLELADTVLIIIVPEIGPLMSTSRFMDLVNKLNLPPDKLKLVLNRSDSKVGLEVIDIEKALKYKINYKLVSGGRDVAISANKGIPLVTSVPNHPLSLGIKQIAEDLLKL